jgi:hypothetical protein
MKTESTPAQKRATADLYDRVAFIADTLLVALVRFVATVLLARKLGPIEVEPQFSALAIEAVLGTITMATLGFAYSSTAPAWAPGDRALVARLGVRRGWRWGAVAMLVGAASGFVPEVGLGPLSGAALGLAMLFGTVAHSLRGVAIARFRSQDMLVATGVWMVPVAIGAIVAALLRPPFDSVHPITLFWLGLALGNAAFVLILRARLRDLLTHHEPTATQHTAENAPAGGPNALREYRLMSRTMIGVGAVNAIGTRAQPMLIGLFAPGVLGLAGAAIMFAGPLRLIGTLLSASLQPRIAGARAADSDSSPAKAIAEELVRPAVLVVVGSVLAAGVLLLAGEFLGVFVLSKPFAGIGQPLAAATLLVGIEAVGLMYAAAAQALGRSPARRSLFMRAGCSLFMPLALWMVLGSAQSPSAQASHALLTLAGVEALFVTLAVIVVTRETRRRWSEAAS